MADTTVELRSVAPYRDERDNVVTGESPATDVRISFRGANNRLAIADGANLGRLHVTFDCDNGVVEIGPNRRSTALSLSVRVGRTAA